MPFSSELREVAEKLANGALYPAFWAMVSPVNVYDKVTEAFYLTKSKEEIMALWNKLGPFLLEHIDTECHQSTISAVGRNKNVWNNLYHVAAWCHNNSDWEKVLPFRFVPKARRDDGDNFDRLRRMVDNELHQAHEQMKGTQFSAEVSGTLYSN